MELGYLRQYDETSSLQPLALTSPPIGTGDLAATPDDFIFVLPTLMLVSGAILGGLRTLLQDWVRPRLMEGLGETASERVERTLQRHPSLPAAAGLSRLFLIVGAVLILAGDLEKAAPSDRFWAGLGMALFGGLMMEGFPALVVRQKARRLVLSAMPLAIVLAILLCPLTFLFERILHLLGADGNGTGGETLTAELIDVAADHDREEELDERERRMIGRVIDLAEGDAASTMTPRTALTAVPQGTSLQGFLQVSLDEGHSRIPVYGQDLDDIRGVLYLKDLMRVQLAGGALAAEKVEDHMREPYFVPETKEVPDLLEEMRTKRIHLAVVVDEYGGTAGVVTIEDLLEEIVGEIQDEHDESEETAEMSRVEDHVMEVEGRVSLYDLNEAFGTDLPEDEDYDTIAGLLFDRMGHIPKEGERLELDDLELTVLEADDRRIHRVRLVRSERASNQVEEG